jgi:DNA invertase Pin-like site-specific DNA recombinase
MMESTIAYYRVSTAKQGRSGLGLDAQRTAVRAFVGSDLLTEFVEVESGRTADRDRPQLAAAIAACKQTRSRLVVAKLDRLARDTRLLLTLVDSGVRVRFVDFPDIPDGAAGRFMLTMLAAVAEFERRLISERTSVALAAAKERGVVLGRAGPANLRRNVQERRDQADRFAANLAPIVTALSSSGLTQANQVARLNEIGVPAPRGGPWTRTQLNRVRARLASTATKCLS